MESPLRELVADRDRLELSLGDALDVKGSIVLVVITFLATLSGSLLESPGLGRYGRLGQLISIVALAVGGVLAVVSVAPQLLFSRSSSKIRTLDCRPQSLLRSTAQSG